MEQSISCFIFLIAVLVAFAISAARNRPLRLPAILLIDFSICIYISRFIDISQYSGRYQYLFFAVWYLCVSYCILKHCDYRPALYSYATLAASCLVYFIFYDLGTRTSDIFMKNWIFDPIQYYQVILAFWWAFYGRIEKLRAGSHYTNNSGGGVYIASGGENR